MATKKTMQKAVKIKTFDDLMSAMLAILPDAELSEDNCGQIVIHTGKKETKTGRLREFKG